METCTRMSGGRCFDVKIDGVKMTKKVVFTGTGLGGDVKSAFAFVCQHIPAEIAYHKWIDSMESIFVDGVEWVGAKEPLVDISVELIDRLDGGDFHKMRRRVRLNHKKAGDAALEFQQIVGNKFDGNCYPGNHTFEISEYPSFTNAYSSMCSKCGMRKKTFCQAGIDDHPFGLWYSTPKEGWKERLDKYIAEMIASEFDAPEDDIKKLMGIIKSQSLGDGSKTPIDLIGGAYKAEGYSAHVCGETLFIIKK